MSSTLIPLHWAIGFAVVALVIIATLVSALLLKDKTVEDREQEIEDLEDLYNDLKERLSNEVTRSGSMVEAMEVMADGSLALIAHPDGYIIRGLLDGNERCGGETIEDALHALLVRESVVNENQAAS
jgi:hypothetical protein